MGNAVGLNQYEGSAVGEIVYGIDAYLRVGNVGEEVIGVVIVMVDVETRVGNVESKDSEIDFDE